MSSGVLAWRIIETAMQALTPAERWSAARKMEPTSVPQYSLIVLAGLILLLLVILLWWVSLGRRTQKKGVKLPRDPFGEAAAKRGLNARERQILLAIATQGNLRQPERIFASRADFDKGATKLLAKFSRTRTLREHRRLQAELVSLCQKLGFAPAKTGSTTDRPQRQSSQSIPVGEEVELLPLEGPVHGLMEATVVRNSETELVVEANSALDDCFGADWRVRYCVGMCMWEFEMRTLNCNGTRLSLSHGNKVRFVDHRRLPRIPINAPALVARFPLVRSLADGVLKTATTAADTEESSGRSDHWRSRCLEFVEGLVTEFAGLSLRVRSTLSVKEGERLLILFGVFNNLPTSTQGHTVAGQQHMIEHIGYVRHCQTDGNETSFTLELTGLDSVEMDGLIRFMTVARAPSHTSEADDSVTTGSNANPDFGVTAKSHQAQGV